MANSKRIAINTIFLYIRMLLIMVITLFTSRVILNKLGVEDYGVYQVVGGVVGFLSFVNAALATGTSRFITFALGENNKDKLHKTFSTAFYIHVIIALIIVVIAETFGLWFLNNKVDIPEERGFAAKVTYHLSVFTAFISLIRVPLNASIIAHEKMSVYAYLGIIEVVFNLAICYLLSVLQVDKLISYTSLLLVVQLFLLFFYCIYCRRSFEEIRFSLKEFDKSIFKQIFNFSGWSLFANASLAINNQGILLLLNNFFTPEIVVARTISLQVNNAATQFVINFRQAANPQIVKMYASDDFEGSKRLLLQSTKFSYFLMLMLALPIYFTAEQILALWLGIVPEYAVFFLKIVIIQSLFQVFDTSFYTALYTKGQIKENALISPLILFIVFPITYVFFKLGYSPKALSWIALGAYVMLGCLVKPYLLIKIANYNLKDILSVFIPCIYVTMLSVLLPIIISFFIEDALPAYIMIVIACIISVAISAFFCGIDSSTRENILYYIKNKLIR